MKRIKFFMMLLFEIFLVGLFNFIIVGTLSVFLLNINELVEGQLLQMLFIIMITGLCNYGLIKIK